MDDLTPVDRVEVLVLVDNVTDNLSSTPACSHAGLVNVLTHARERFGEVPLHAMLDGFHPSGGNERVIPDTVDAIETFDLKVIAPAHCTGWRAVSALAGRYGGCCANSDSGTILRICKAREFRSMLIGLPSHSRYDRLACLLQARLENLARTRQVL